MPEAAIIEMDEERDRKTCIALDQKVSGANRELAEWLINHPRYSNRVIGKWLGCPNSRISYLRKWARAGFVGSPFGRENKPVSKPDHPGDQRPLKTNDYFDEDGEIIEGDDDHQEDPAGFIVAVIKNAKEKADIAIRNLPSAVDEGERAQIVEAIDALIRRWESVKRKIRVKEAQSA